MERSKSKIKMAFFVLVGMEQAAYRRRLQEVAKS